MLTLEERERRAYITGNVELAAALAESVDVVSDEVDELRHENGMLKAELADTEDELDVANGRIAELEAQIDERA